MCGVAAAALDAAAASIHWQRGQRKDPRICAAAALQQLPVVASRCYRLSQPEARRAHNPTAVRLLLGCAKMIQLHCPVAHPQQALGCECCGKNRHVIHYIARQLRMQTFFGRGGGAGRQAPGRAAAAAGGQRGALLRGQSVLVVLKRPEAT